MDKLTNYQILEAFPDEIKEIVPREISRLEKDLTQLKEDIKDINSLEVDQYIKDFYISSAIMFSHKKDQINRLQELKKLVNMNKIKDFKSPNLISQDRILKAKSFPIKDMYSFDKISQYGNKMKASCPFHEDKTPSFYIYPSNSFHCFSCGIGGSSVDFYMKINKVTFKQAVLAITQ